MAVLTVIQKTTQEQKRVVYKTPPRSVLVAGKPVSTSGTGGSKATGHA